jgi:hypothetical protein
LDHLVNRTGPVEDVVEIVIDLVKRIEDVPQRTTALIRSVEDF